MSGDLEDSGGEFGLLSAISVDLESNQAGIDPIWDGSPFRWLLALPAGTKGKIFEQMVQSFFNYHGFDIRPARGPEADLVVDNLRVEVKGSTLWNDNHSYWFQQLRDQDYDVAVCLGFSPFSAHCWVIPKHILMDGVGHLQGLTPQHGGQSGRDTAALRVYPRAVQNWLQDYGGTLAEATAVLSHYVGKVP